MEQLRVLIAEDELVLAHATAEMLNNIGCDNVLIGHQFTLAKTILEGGEVDVALLDINLGKGEEGLELANICSNLQIPFIYISSYSDRNTLDKALKTRPRAYLNKPISEASLYTTLQILVSKMKENQQNETLVFKDGTETVMLPLKTIKYLKAENIYVNVITDSRTFLFRGSLGALVSKVSNGLLIQTHRAYAINPSHIQRVASSHVVLHCGSEIPVSRHYKVQLPKTV